MALFQPVSQPVSSETVTNGVNTIPLFRSKMSSLVEIRNVEEIYIHYFADKVRGVGVTDVSGECKPMVFSLTQIGAEHFCQEGEHFVSEKCDRQLKGMQDFCQNEKTGAVHLASSETSSGSGSRTEVDLMGKPIGDSRVPSHGAFKDADGRGGGKNKTNATAALDIERMKENELKKKEDGKKGKERVREVKVTGKGRVGSEELRLHLESFLDLPKRRKDATTQVEKGLMRRLLGKKPKIYLV